MEWNNLLVFKLLSQCELFLMLKNWTIVFYKILLFRADDVLLIDCCFEVCMVC